MASTSIVTPELRDLLFADIPLAQLARFGGRGEPWQSFVVAQAALDGGDKDRAVSTLQSIVAILDLEARPYLEGWSALRSLGVQADSAVAQQLCGIVIEVSLPGGVDTLAAYMDMSARYYNHARYLLGRRRGRSRRAGNRPTFGLTSATRRSSGASSAKRIATRP